MGHRTGIWVLGTIAFCAESLACSSAEPLEADESAPLASASDDLYYLSTGVWPQRDVPVCWLTSGFATEKAWVQEALVGQRSWASAGNINFVGWGNCGSSTTGIQLQGGSFNQSTNRLGYSPSAPTVISLDFRASMETTYTRCVDNGLTREQCIKASTLHEFGHAIAYAHEQNRGSPPPECGVQTTQGTNGDTTFGNFDTPSITAYCNFSTELSSMDRRGTDRVYGPRLSAEARLADYNGDGRADFVCRDVLSGGQWIDYANSSGQFNDTDWTGPTGWCNSDFQRRIFKGDFDGDGRSDELCYAMTTGAVYVDYANSSGQFNGIDFQVSNGFCNGAETRRVYVGDFNGDGRDDFLCHDRVNGNLGIDYADSSGHFNDSDWSATNGFCNSATTRRVSVGDFNGDGKADLLCYDLASGRRWIDYANGSGQFNGIDWTDTSNWCGSDQALVLVGDFNGDGKSDLLCHNGETGTRLVDYANSSGQFGGTDFTASDNWCTSNGSHLFVGDVNGDGKDDLVCHNVASGSLLVDYADSSGHFGGTDHTVTSGECNGSGTRETL